MSARIVPLTALTFILLTIFWAVVATAQSPGDQPMLPQPQQFAQAPAPQVAQPLPQAPFQLAPEEQVNLDRVLVDWQNMSGKVKTFEGRFTRIDYDGVFGNANQPKRVVPGVIKYSAPDKGFYDLDDKSEKWICTGDAVFEFRADLKEVREHPLPPNMRGKAIVDGPMPFVFGVEAQKAKARYWMRITTPAEAVAKSQVWIEAYPKFAKDAGNFYKIDVILQFAVENGQVTKLEPFAINMVHPNQKDRTVYRFESQQVNTFLGNLGDFIGVFIRPATPLGWQHKLMEEADTAGLDAGGQPGQPPVGVGAAPGQTLPR